MEKPLIGTIDRDKLTAALIKASSAFKHIKKDAYNPHFKSKFASLAEIIEATKEALTANGILVVHEPSSNSDGRIGVTTRLLHTTGQEIGATLLLRPASDGPQAYGSAISYARRYNLLSLLNLAADDDDGNDASTPVHTPRQQYADASGNKAPAPQQPSKPVSGDPGEYIVRVGKKFAGMKIRDIEPNAMLSYISYLQETSKRDGRPMGQTAQEFVDYAKAFLAKDADQGPPVEDMPPFDANEVPF